MKKVIMTMLLLLAGVTYTVAQDVEEVQVAEPENEHINGIALNWIESFKEAHKKSVEEKKPILILFSGSDWCTPCKNLEEKVLHTEEFKKYAEYFTLYKADFPRNLDLVSTENKKANKQLKKKYNQESFPTILIVDTKGNIIDKRSGVYMYDSYMPFFEGVVNRIKMTK